MPKLNSLRPKIDSQRAAISVAKNQSQRPKIYSQRPNGFMHPIEERSWISWNIVNFFKPSAFQLFNRGFILSISSKILEFPRTFDLFIRGPYSWFYGNITTFSTFRRLNQWSKWLEACRMYSPRRYFSLHPGWLKLRLKILGAILILMWFSNVVFVDFLNVGLLRERAG